MPTRWTDIVPGTPPAPVNPVTISNITTTAITYGGGAGTQFVLQESPVVFPTSWSPVQTNNATPGIFTISTGVGQKFYRIQSR
jgi:hypothetical protein